MKPVLCALCAAGGALVWLGFLAVLLVLYYRAAGAVYLASARHEREAEYR